VQTRVSHEFRLCPETPSGFWPEELFSLLTMATQVCPGRSGYVNNADDCDDSSDSIKPGVSICANDDVVRQSCVAAGGGVWKQHELRAGLLRWQLPHRRNHRIAWLRLVLADDRATGMPAVVWHAAA
jgi:hypothetical protein